MTNWPAGVARVELAQTDSTMAEAMRQAQAGTKLPVWIRVDAQTAGRGRRGRAWVPGPGNFYASLVMEVDGPPDQAALRSFATALALADTLQGLGIAKDQLALKWPNDVLLQGRKLAGILLESTRVSGRGVLIVGIGVNLATAPPKETLECGAVQPIALGETGLNVTPSAFLDALAPAFDTWEQVFKRQGFTPLRTAWLARAARLGEVITARLPDRQISGRFETVDPSGAIVLDTPDGRVSLPAAEIFF